MDESPIADDVTTTLDDLPLDIIRLILAIVGQPMDSLRLISPTWNAMVAEYLSCRRNHPPLHTVVFSKMFKESNSVRVSLRAKARMPYQKNPGWAFRGWTSLQIEQFKLNMESPELYLRRKSASEALLMPLLFISIIIFYYFEYIFGAIFFLIMTCFAVKEQFIISRTLEKNRQIVRQTFHRCSNIEDLEVDYSMLTTVRELLGDVHVKNLSVFGSILNEAMRKNIVEMCRTQKVQCVNVYVAEINDEKLHEFFNDVLRNSKEMEILESPSARSNIIFGRPIEFWLENFREMSDELFTVEIVAGRYLEWQRRFRIKARHLNH